MKNFLLKISILLSVFTLPIVLAASHESINILAYKPKVELTGKLGYSPKKSAKRNIARLGFVLPIFQKMDRYITFLSVIGMKDSAKHLEGNFGGGYRAFINPRWILGGYGFYDARKTENDNLIHQVTIGMEALSKDLECRINIYIPFGNDHDLGTRNIYEINYSQQRHITTFKNSRQNLTEIGLSGFDIEAGGSLPKYSKYEGFLAVYYFNAKSIQSVLGVRIRANFILTHWFSIEAESNIDKKIGHTSYLGMKLSWDFSSHKSKNFQTPINRKMTQLPVRDIDAITAVREDTPISIVTDTVKGRVAAILPKGVLTDGSIIKANVPIDIEDVNNINKSIGLISDIAIISKGGEIIHYVGSDELAKQATQKELTDYNLNNIDPQIVDKKTNTNFRKAIAKLKKSNGVSDFDNVVSGLIDPNEAFQGGKLTNEEASIAGLIGGCNANELEQQGFAIPDIKQAANSKRVTVKQALDSKALTEDEAIEKGIREGLNKEQLNRLGFSEQALKKVANSDSITPKQAFDSKILTKEEAIASGINNGLTKQQLMDDGMSEQEIRNTAKSSRTSPRKAIESGALTKEEATAAGINNGLTKQQLMNNDISEQEIKKAAKSSKISPRKAIESGILTREEATISGINNGLNKKQLKGNGLSDMEIKQVANSGSITPKQAFDSKILTKEEAIATGINNGLTKKQLMDDGMSEQEIRNTAKSSKISPRKAIESGILTREEATISGINNGLNKKQLKGNGLSDMEIKQAACSAEVSPRKAIESGILTRGEAAISGINNGLNKKQLKDNGLSNREISNSAYSPEVSPRRTIESGIYTPTQAAGKGVRQGLTREQLEEDNGLSVETLTESLEKGFFTPGMARDIDIITEQEAKEIYKDPNSKVVQGINSIHDYKYVHKFMDEVFQSEPTSETLVSWVKDSHATMMVPLEKFYREKHFKPFVERTDLNGLMNVLEAAEDRDFTASKQAYNLEEKHIYKKYLDCTDLNAKQNAERVLKKMIAKNGATGRKDKFEDVVGFWDKFYKTKGFEAYNAAYNTRKKFLVHRLSSMKENYFGEEELQKTTVKQIADFYLSNKVVRKKKRKNFFENVY